MPGLASHPRPRFLNSLDYLLSWRNLLAFLAILWLYMASVSASGNACMHCKQSDAVNVASLGALLNSSMPLGSCHCDTWILSATAVDQSECSSSNFLLFEFWRMNGSALDTRLLGNVYFMVARSIQPSLNFSSNTPIYYPPRSLPNLYNGTNMDFEGYNLFRPYLRMFLPVNASGPDSASMQTGLNDWHITVGNMEPNGIAEPFHYTMRVTCVAEEAAPCPRPSPFDTEDCSGNGKCGPAPWQGLPRPGLRRVCYCDDPWGDYGCQEHVPRLAKGGVQSKVIEPDTWAYWQISMPLPRALGMGPKPALLVELSRTPVYAGGLDTDFGTTAARDWPQSYGGDPLLVVMPKGVNDSNRLPYLGDDVRRFGDLRSYYLQQNYHYLLWRDLPRTLPASKVAAEQQASGRPEEETSEFYVAVYNSYRFWNLMSPQAKANVTLRVRWHTGGDRSPLCPNDCFGRGKCFDPQDPTPPLPRPAPDLQPQPNTPVPDFQCSCNAGFGGTMCEGTLRNVTVAVAEDISTGNLSPGEWAFLVLNLDRRFDYKSDDVAIYWLVKDTLGAQPSDLKNAYMTVSMQSFPRNSVLESSGTFTRAWQVFYDTLTKKSNVPQPLLLKGFDLQQGFSYVLGIYNSDYQRVVPSDFDYGVTVYVPVSPRTWLHPYMSVVLGVTASIILCLLMTLCRRVVQRYGWGPFQSRDPITGPDGTRVQVTPMASRPRGVPDSIIETFRTYEYHATKAEKEQLARSCRDHQEQQQQEQQQQQAGAMGDGVQVHQLSQQQSLRRPTSAAVREAAASAAATALASPMDATAPPGSAVTAPPSGASGGNQMEVLGFPPPATAAPAPAVLTPAAYTGDDNDEPQCTVCLCEYEEGERITQLPCKHEFHSTCINKWLRTHCTCPICRVALLPDEQQHNQNHDQQPAAAPMADAAQDGTASDGTVVVVGSGAAASPQESSQSTGAGAEAGGGNGGPPLPVATAPPPQGAGFMARLLSRGRRSAALSRMVAQQAADGGGGVGRGRTSAVAMVGATSPSSYGPPPPPLRGTPGGIAESRGPSDPAPTDAPFAHRSPRAGSSGGAPRTIGIGGPVVLPSASSGPTQILAHGPSAVLELPSGGVGDSVARRSAGGSPSTPAQVSPSRLAAGRHSARPILLGSDANAPLTPMAAAAVWTGGSRSSGGSGGADSLALRNPTTLGVPIETVGPEVLVVPPGMSSPYSDR